MTLFGDLLSEQSSFEDSVLLGEWGKQTAVTVVTYQTI